MKIACKSLHLLYVHLRPFVLRKYRVESVPSTHDYYLTLNKPLIVDGSEKKKILQYQILIGMDQEAYVGSLRGFLRMGRKVGGCRNSILKYLISISPFSNDRPDIEAFRTVFR